jgi:hypothetical protein
LPTCRCDRVGSVSSARSTAGALRGYATHDEVLALVTDQSEHPVKILLIGG